MFVPLVQKTVSDIECYCNENGVPSQERQYMLEEAFQNDYETLPISEKVEWLMSTCCGAEFAYYEFDSYEDLLIDNKECAEWYMREYPEKFQIGE